MQDGPERKDVLMFGMATRSYVEQWDDLHLFEGVLYRTWRSKDGLHQYEQFIAPCEYQIGHSNGLYMSKDISEWIEHASSCDNEHIGTDGRLRFR